MALFKKKKKACCGSLSTEDINHAEENKKSGAALKILGSGCAKCSQLEANALAACKQLGLDTVIDHVSDFTQIAAYGVMTTPALVWNGNVLAYGKVLSTDEIIELLKKAGVQHAL